LRLCAFRCYRAANSLTQIVKAPSKSASLVKQWEPNNSGQMRTRLGSVPFLRRDRPARGRWYRAQYRGECHWRTASAVGLPSTHPRLCPCGHHAGAHYQPDRSGYRHSSEPSLIARHKPRVNKHQHHRRIDRSGAMGAANGCCSADRFRWTRAIPRGRRSLRRALLFSEPANARNRPMWTERYSMNRVGNWGGSIPVTSSIPEHLACSFGERLSQS
jgi:hypothetical protein